MKPLGTTRKTAWAAMALLPFLLSFQAVAKSPQAAAREGERTYIVVLDQPSLARWYRAQAGSREYSLQADKSARGSGKREDRRLDVRSESSRRYLDEVDRKFEDFRHESSARMGRNLELRHRYRVAINGFAARLSAEEALEMSSMPGVRMIAPDKNYRKLTDAGPGWLGADDIWSGAGSLPQTRGEGIVIGVIDSGVNWDHPSFADPGEGGGSGHDHINPKGSQLGLCSDAEVPCNDKLIGVYNYIEDNPDTASVNEDTKGKDDSGHGTHVASTAAGNTLAVTNSGIPFNISGVAPNANLVTYKVCTDGDPADPEDDVCAGQDILLAIDQAISDGVDVINYSLGSSDPGSPWNDAVSLAFLNAFGAGIFVATSASNDGPSASTIGSPANSPWITGVGNATHNRLFGSQLSDLTGGDTTPPDDMFGASLTSTSGFRDIVHARDFGNALCGTGTEELGSTCAQNTGASNPFAPGTFNGQIVVCDRGQYGRIEKGKNVQLAGAAGMILANTNLDGESIVADEHCLPAIHIGDLDGDVLRDWLESGSGHRGNITGFDRIVDDSLGDRVIASSSRGPGQPPVEDVLKPNLIAPGNGILAAWIDNPPFFFLDGTSMSSPHVAGAAALLLAANNSWSPSMVSSALQLTATPDQALDFDGTPATLHERGAGRPRIALAANTGLFLDETAADFQNANPQIGGSPRNLNLPGLVDSSCKSSCSFSRTVTDMAGGRTWTAAPSGFPAGVTVTVTPAEFTLANAGSRTLVVDIEMGDANVVGSWVYGDIVLTASGLPDAVLPTAVFASGGELTDEWEITANQDSGWKEFGLSGLINMPQATFTGAGLVTPGIDTSFLNQDLSRSDPYDSPQGTATVWHDVPEGSLWLHSSTQSPTATDVDLFVGLDVNENGAVDEEEEICSSTTPTDVEQCDILNPEAGRYWILVQNWDDGPSGVDEIVLASAVISPDGSEQLVATGPGVTSEDSEFNVRVSWRDVAAVEGEELLGAVAVGTHADNPSNIGVIPVIWRRNAIADAKTLPLVEGYEHGFALAAGTEHDHAFIDVPPGASELTVTASGASARENDGLLLDLHRVDFNSAFTQAPFAAPAPDGTPAISAAGSGGSGPQAVVSGGNLQPGRWYTVVRNTGGSSSAVTLRADVEFNGMKIPVKGNLLVSVNRGGISQGIDYQPVGMLNSMIWYTYRDDHRPVWYLSAATADDGNIWSGDLLRFTNDGSEDRFSKVGKVTVTSLGEKDSIFSWTLFGESGSERMGVVTGEDSNPCPLIGGQPTSISGFWGKAQPGLGGASVLLTDGVHAEIHYLYDDDGNPVWLQAAGAQDGGLVMSQFEGFCPTCPASNVTNSDVGVITPAFSSESAGQWNLDYQLGTPLSGDVNRDDSVVKLSDVRACD